jgi:hypothetical protein
VRTGLSSCSIARPGRKLNRREKRDSFLFEVPVVWDYGVRIRSAGWVGSGHLFVERLRPRSVGILSLPMLSSRRESRTFLKSSRKMTSDAHLKIT